MSEKQPKDFAYDAWCKNNGVEPLTIMERALGNGKHIERVFRLAREHTIQGFFRYGSMQAYRDNPIDFVQKIDDCIMFFEEDGNIEHFLDIINWAAIGFVYTDHPKKHYECHNKEHEEKTE